MNTLPQLIIVVFWRWTQRRRHVIILVADSTFLTTSGSTKGEKDEHGNWHFTDDSVAFSGKGHHKHATLINPYQNDMEEFLPFPL